MNTRNASYGSVSFNGTHYYVQFWNPMTQTREFLGCFKQKDEAQKAFNWHSFEFYSENSWILPKCISLNRRDRKFKFALPIGNKTVHYGQYETLQEAVDAKMEFINKLLV